MISFIVFPHIVSVPLRTGIRRVSGIISFRLARKVGIAHGADGSQSGHIIGEFLDSIHLDLETLRLAQTYAQMHTPCHSRGSSAKAWPVRSARRPARESKYLRRASNKS